jgi:hypothetical protein
MLGSINFDAPPPRARVVVAQHGRPHAGPDAVRGHHHASIHIRHAAVKVQCDVPLMLRVAQHLVPAANRSARDQLCKCALGLQQNTRWRGGGWGGRRFIAVAWGGGYLVGLGRVVEHGTGRSRGARLSKEHTVVEPGKSRVFVGNKNKDLDSWASEFWINPLNAVLRSATALLAYCA